MTFMMETRRSNSLESLRFGGLGATLLAAVMGAARPGASAELPAAPTITAPATDRSLKLQDGAVLRSTDPSLFRNQSFIARERADGVIDLAPAGDLIDFSALQKLRKDKANAERTSAQVIDALKSTDGLRLSNVGVSIALTVEMSGAEYALLVTQQRPDGRVAKLISGYFDASRREKDEVSAHDLRNARNEELTDELIIVKDGAILPVVLRQQDREQRLPSAYGLPEHQTRSVVMMETGRPGYLTALSNPARVAVNGEVLEGCGIYIDKTNNSGQVVFYARMTLPEGATVVHVEDVLDKQSNKLNSTVRSGDLLFVPVNRDGRLGQFPGYERTTLSEVFCPAKGDRLVEKTNTPAASAVSK